MLLYTFIFKIVKTILNRKVLHYFLVKKYFILSIIYEEIRTNFYFSPYKLYLKRDVVFLFELE